MLLTHVLHNALTLGGVASVLDNTENMITFKFGKNINFWDSLKVLKALLVSPLLADLLGHLHHGVVALLPQPRVAPSVDLLTVLHIL